MGGRSDLGGMEQAFSAKIMTHLDSHFSHVYTFLPWYFSLTLLYISIRICILKFLRPWCDEYDVHELRQAVVCPRYHGILKDIICNIIWNVSNP